MIFEYKKLSDDSKIDLIPYIKQYLELHPEAGIFVGCDSQNAKRTTNFIEVYMLYIIFFNKNL